MRYSPSPEETGHLDTDALRAHFLVEDLFRPGEVALNYWNPDRTIVGSAVPTGRGLALNAPEMLAAHFFTERRELGVLNIGPGRGKVEVEDGVYPATPRDIVYVGRGNETVIFHSEDASEPARFYLVSHPAHQTYPTASLARTEADCTELGSQAKSSRRDLLKYIYPGGLDSAQLVMGLTEVREGNVWNTMPPHTHERRSEVYMYFGLDSGEVVFHLMGAPRETQTIVVRNGEAVLSPSWSIHAGAGTSNYTFCWAMGGENQAFDDMQGVATKNIR